MDYKKAWEEYIETIQSSTYMQRLTLANEEKLFKAGFEYASNFNVKRFEIIDHTSDGEGRAYIKRGDIVGEIELQDEGKTLKVFLK